MWLTLPAQKSETTNTPQMEPLKHYDVIVEPFRLEVVTLPSYPFVGPSYSQPMLKPNVTVVTFWEKVMLMEEIMHQLDRFIYIYNIYVYRV